MQVPLIRLQCGMLSNFTCIVPAKSAQESIATNGVRSNHTDRVESSCLYKCRQSRTRIGSGQIRGSYSFQQAFNWAGETICGIMDGNAPVSAFQRCWDAKESSWLGSRQPSTYVHGNRQEIWREATLPIQGSFDSKSVEYSSPSEQEVGGATSFKGSEELSRYDLLARSSSQLWYVDL